MLLQVHDELVFEAPEAEAERLMRGRQARHGARLTARRGAIRAAGSGSAGGQELGRGALTISFSPCV